ncbi:MAG TPA: lysophospholipid acyltransferase family protein [Abditibacteriaceae bacterium]|jgi:1-acyl-sn-glycerol-3-phosphate acyltransferase
MNESLKESSPPLSPSRSYRLAYPWAKVKLQAFIRCLAPRLRVEGTIHVPRRGGVLLTPNHISDADPPFVGLCAPRPLWFMAKRGLWHQQGVMKYLGPVISWMQAFPVDPDSADREALRYAEDLLEAKQALVIFPEGRIAHNETIPLQPGAVMLALRAKVPVVPVGIAGTQYVIPYGHLLPRPTLMPVAVVYGAPVRFDDLIKLPRRAAREAAAERLEKAMTTVRARAEELAR